MIRVTEISRAANFRDGDEESGRDSMSFGPLNRTGGERRLNVAVTRSREAITLVSSIRSDMVMTLSINTKNTGVRSPSPVASEQVCPTRNELVPVEFRQPGHSTQTAREPKLAG